MSSQAGVHQAGRLLSAVRLSLHRVGVELYTNAYLCERLDAKTALRKRDGGSAVKISWP